MIEQLLFSQPAEIKKPILTYEVDPADLKQAFEEACMQIDIKLSRRQLLKIREIKSNKNRKPKRYTKIYLPIF